jgi:pullulanase
MEFIPIEGSNLIAFILKDYANGDTWKNIVVAYNSRTEAAQINVPFGNYTIVCKDGDINTKGMGKVKGSSVTVPARSALIMHQ